MNALRATALFVALAGAACSAGFTTLRASQRNSPRLLLVLMAIWVMSPFIAFIYASVVAKRWPVPTQVRLYRAMLVVTLGSVAIYGVDALHPLSAKGAPVFVSVPAASWLIFFTVVAVAVFKKDS